MILLTTRNIYIYIYVCPLSFRLRVEGENREDSWTFRNGFWNFRFVTSPNCSTDVSDGDSAHKIVQSARMEVLLLYVVPSTSLASLATKERIDTVIQMQRLDSRADRSGCHIIAMLSLDLLPCLSVVRSCNSYLTTFIARIFHDEQLLLFS